MFRLVARTLLLTVLLAAVLDSTGRGQPGGSDRIYYRDKKDRDGSVKSADGEVKASPGGYQIVAGAKIIPVSPTDIVRLIPGDLPGVDKGDLLAQDALEIKKDWEKARVGYEEMKKKAGGAAPERTKKFLDFKLATTAARVADDTAEDAGWKEKATAAATLLSQYVSDNKTGWELFVAGRTCARLQLELGQFDASARTWARLAGSADLPAALRQEAAYHEIDTLLRSKRFPDAGAKIAEALKTAPAGPAKDRLLICQIASKFGDANPLEGVAPIEAEIAKTKDPATRAVGYSMEGELYLAAGKPREAMWALLWVEVVYNQDRDEVARALVRLADAFQQQGDEDRARATREKLRRHRGAL